MADRAALSRVMLLLIKITQDFTQAATDKLGAGNTSNRQVQILMALHEHGGMTPSELATGLGVSRSSMSHALARFEEDHLISRAVDRHDRRSVRLSLTPRGQSRMRAFESALEGLLVREGPELRAVLALLDWPVDAIPGAGVSTRKAVQDLTASAVTFLAEVLPALRAFGVVETSDRFAIALIQDRGAMRPTQLAEELLMSSSGTCTLLDRLAAVGLVQRCPGDDEGDRRAVVVSLTERGREAAAVSLDVLERQWPALGAAMASALIKPSRVGVA